MSTIWIAEGTYNGSPFSVSYYHRPTFWDGLGCHTACVQHLGYVIVGGVKYGGQTYGVWHSEGTLFSFTTHGGGNSGVPLSVIRDAVYGNIMSRYTSYGVVIFSDRINRGTSCSVQSYLPMTANPKIGATPERIIFSCASLAKWLADKPELGTLVTGAFMNNPNYQTIGNWGICQVWMWHPKGKKIWTDETVGPVGPDMIIPKETVVQGMKKELGFDLSAVTYDEVN